MYNKLFFICLLLFLLLPTFSSAQYILPNFQSQTLYKKQFLLRWEPRSVQEWEQSLQTGYQVKVFSGTNNDHLILQKTETIQAQDPQTWDLAIAEQRDSILQEFYAGAKSFLYMPKEIEKELESNLEKEAGKSIQQTVSEFKLGYLNYAITYDFGMIQKAGLGYSVPVEEGKIYRIEVQTHNYPAYTFYYAPAQRTTAGIPDLAASFADKKVAVEWATPAFKTQYFGYFLSISENGKKFKKVNQMPYVNLLDTLQGNDDYQLIKEEVQLQRNYKTYWLRLTGMNYFGLESRLSSVKKGYGFEIIDAMPTIHHSDQTRDNQADIRWTLDRRFNRLIDHFEIHRAGEINGKYEVVYTDIPAEQRKVLIPMEHNRNYFNIVLVPKDGPVIQSFSTFIMGQDTVPPIPPQHFVGSIDSMGVVTLNWDSNTEEDLWGYKVFRSEYIDDEFGNLHASPILDTFYVDTVNLHSITEEIHYTIIALDKRNNRSAFAPIISLERPDTIPPSPPLIRVAQFMEDSIQLTWAASSSSDAVRHQLFRKEVQGTVWDLIAEYKQVNEINI
ncbi:MAG: hypothetical protein AAF985_23165, partial [Bacteroidota bacterium]